MKKFKSLLIVCALALGFAPLAISGVVKEEPNVVYATGGEPNAPATADQVYIYSQSASNLGGTTFVDGVLTINNVSFCGSYDYPALIFVNTNVTADLKVVINQNNFCAVFANLNGNLTIESNVNALHAYQIYAGGNLTITGIGTLFIHDTNGVKLSSPYPTRYSIAYAGEKISIGDKDVYVSGWVSSSTSFKSVLCAKSLEINSKEQVRLTTNETKGALQAPIVFHSCNSANDLADKLVIRQGALELKKGTGDNDFDFVGYTSDNSGAISNMYTNFDTENKAFTGYEIVKTNTDLIVKTRSVDFRENGGTFDERLIYRYLPIKTEPETVTLPECPYTAPVGKQFAGWALESLTATPLKQPGDTFVLEDNGYEYDSSNYLINYYIVYAIWEDDAPTQYSITVYNGTASAASSVAGETITITANAPEEGYEFDRWTSDDVTFANANNTTTTFVMPAKNVTITAIYKAVAIETTLSSITLSGNPKTIFEVDDTFTYEGLVVTAHYSDETSHAVNDYTVSSPDMSTFGIKTVTVSYTESAVTKTATYQITVNEKSVTPPVDPETPEQPSKGLSAGAVVGIVIGSVVVVGIGGFALVWFVIKKKTWADFLALFKKK